MFSDHPFYLHVLNENILFVIRHTNIFNVHFKFLIIFIKSIYHCILFFTKITSFVEDMKILLNTPHVFYLAEYLLIMLMANQDEVK